MILITLSYLYFRFRFINEILLLQQLFPTFRVPFVIINKDDDSKLDAEIVLNFDRYEVADEKWFAFKKAKASSTDCQSNRNDNTHTSDLITN
uniref:Uncharacterized protein n=1 Tax=Romanomermis culicivorax TaxID=13658 RepID=A0A915HMB7_ROMCU